MKYNNTHQHYHDVSPIVWEKTKDKRIKTKVKKEKAIGYRRQVQDKRQKTKVKRQK